MRDMLTPADTEQPQFKIIKHVFDRHFFLGKWQAYLCSNTGKGIYTGPRQAYGTFQVFGKVVQDAQALPLAVLELLAANSITP